MMATGATAEVVEVGYFGAGQFIPCEELSAGMVGYLTASLKECEGYPCGRYGDKRIRVPVQSRCRVIKR